MFADKYRTLVLVTLKVVLCKEKVSDLTFRP